jgi:nuclear transport factor 2 (NTF2) superfamily protein
MSYIGQLEKSFLPEQLAQIRDILTRYIAQQLSFQDCLGILMPVLGSPQPIEKLEAILRTPQFPLPCHGPPTAVAQDVRAKTRPWSSYEDQRLLAGIYRFGFVDWQLIAMFVGNGRTKAQCSQRWTRGLDPKLCKEQWSTEEDARLVDLVALYGEKSWTRIVSELGNRCDVQCRYRYKQLQKDVGFEEKLTAAIERAKSVDFRKMPKSRVKPTDHIRPPLAMMSAGIAKAPVFGQHFQMLAQPRPMPVAPQLPPAAMEPEKRVSQPLTHIPHGDVDLEKLASQAAIPGFEPPHAPAQGSSLIDWTAPFGVSASGSLFGISPVNSFKMDS